MTASTTPSAKPAYAVLCTPNKTFQLRQVQTSNSLFITQPAYLEDHANEIPVPATCAIALCSATLELQPSTASGLTLLKENLPVYNIVAGDVDAVANNRTKATIFEDTPLSYAELQEGWRQLMAFELDESSYQPSVNALAQVWRAINAAALAEAVKLDSQFLTVDIASAVAEDGHPIDLVEGVLAHLASESADTSGAWSSLDRTKTVAFVGKTLLEARTGADFLIADFTDTWEDRLPEAWRKDAQLSAIEEFYEFPSETTIRSKGKAATGATGDSTLASTKPSARKWHEKFGKTRNK